MNGNSSKRQKAQSNSPLNVKLFTPTSVKGLQKQHEESQPYKHIVISDLCEFDRMKLIHEEATHNFTANFKETDLFKLYQTGDLGAIDVNDINLQSKIPNIISLRSALYSQEFRSFVSNITGCGELTDRTDCSTNAYANGCHLLTHDDVIGTRRISYIIYFSDPEESWHEEDGGGLELYPLNASTAIDRGTQYGGIQGIPESIPTKIILPSFNSMVLFVVQPGRSYHSVQEVYSQTRPRLSISGWYHAVDPPIGSDFASLQQIMNKGDHQASFARIPSLSFSECIMLSTEDREELSHFVNPTYLTDKSILQVQKRFIRDSSMQLKSFLRAELSSTVYQSIQSVDRYDHLGRGAIPPGYHVGISSDWSIIGPPHKRRYLSYNPSTSLRHRISAQSTASSDDHPDMMNISPGLLLDTIRISLFRSPAFLRYLYLLTNLQPIGYKDEVRRFRPGLDYTVAYYGAMTTVPRLDATLCFVDESDDAAKPNNDDEDNEDDDNDLEPAVDLWESGDVGGFECYIEVDSKDTAEAAEVYQSKAIKSSDKNAEAEDDGSLLSVSAGKNVLSLVMRDENVMRFVKYLSYNAPGSRWDISAEYELDIDTEDNDE